MSGTFQKALTIANTDTYTFTVPALWLGDETISSHNVIVDAKVTKNSSGVTDNVIGVSITGVTAGNSELHYELTTSGGRSDCAVVTVKVVTDCQ